MSGTKDVVYYFQGDTKNAKKKTLNTMLYKHLLLSFPIGLPAFHEGFATKNTPSTKDFGQMIHYKSKNICVQLRSPKNIQSIIFSHSFKYLFFT